MFLNAQCNTDYTARRRDSISDNTAIRMLLVEDHRPTAHALFHLLQHSGYQVTLAASVEEALLAASREQFDLVISDICLPDATGYQLMQEIHARYGLRGIAMTGLDTQGNPSRFSEAGFVEHLMKPVGFDLLQAAIGRVTAQTP